MCIIDRSKPSVFDQNSLDGILEGSAAATWGGPTTAIQAVSLGKGGDTERPFPLYDLSGRRVSADTKGLVIANGKKWIMK